MWWKVSNSDTLLFITLIRTNLPVSSSLFDDEV